MGILDRLIDGIKHELQTEIKKAFAGDSASRPTAATPTAAAPVTNVAGSSVSARYEPKFYDTGDAYFAAMLTEDKFPGYTIERAVHPNTLDASAHPKCYPISYLFKREGTPVLAVLVMNRNQSRAMISVGTYSVLDDNGIRYIRFYKGMENQESYVINRIKENLN